MEKKFSKEDLLFFKQKGASYKQINAQIEQFKNGIPFLKLKAPAIIGKGIIKLQKKEVSDLCLLFDKHVNNVSVLKFVPASGAASRMFKDVFALREMCQKSPNENKTKKRVSVFFASLKKYAFFNELEEVMSKNNIDIENCIKNKDFITVSEYLLNESGLNYANTPKALISFHDYKTNSRKSIEEHLVEAALYCKNVDKVASLHFTVSPEHEERIKAHIVDVIQKYIEKFEISFNISYSFQKPSTDTIAVDMDNKPFREADGSLLFRPGGHGALIENLNECKSQLIFIKNIDNVVPDRLKEETITYKKAIGGLLIKLTNDVAKYLYMLENKDVSDEILSEIMHFATTDLCINLMTKGKSKDEIKALLIKKLNRPLRICGMVKNQGEPGGGPFWVENINNGEKSLQIVESSQVNIQDDEQSNILKKSTHFNPVDLVCWMYDYKGKKFNLLDFVDNQTGFISIKSKDGRELKALELPGLWNGAMADWISVFVDVPLITFNPVKTIDDLLRIEHKA